jgi:iron complex outermembrane recepter protein
MLSVATRVASCTPGQFFVKASYILSLATALFSVTAIAQTVPSGSTTADQSLEISLPNVNVVGSTPLQGSGVDRNKIPANTSVLTGADLQRTGPANLLRGLDERVGGIDLDEAVGNPSQPNLLYRGFEASPLAGDAQGLAVYINGTRFNSSFADTVNFDVIPSIAIDKVDLVGSNPAFGLNALGGALSLQMKNGFTFQGGELELSGGSFGRIVLSGEYGRQVGNVSVYAAISGLNEDGWREHSPSQLRQFYGDIGWRGDRAEAHINIDLADNNLIGNGTTPVELLAADRAAVFTYPDETRNKYLRVVATGTYSVADNTSVQANAYYSNLSQRTYNGDAGDQEVCDDNPALVCEQDGPPLTTSSGHNVPNFAQNSPYNQVPGFIGAFANGGPYSVLNRTATDSNSFGVSAQVTNTDQVLGRPNHAVLGVSYDGGRTRFAADTLLGGFTLDRDFMPAAGGQTYELNLADNSITPVRVGTSNDYYGIYFVDTLDVTPRLSATLSGRFNSAQIDLNDQLGTALTGQHSYNRFNPAFGVTYKLTSEISAYAGYAESNRAPTPSELSCANPLAPCSLTNFFVGDPDLKQVVAHTWEVGLNGHARAFDGRLDWHAGYFRTASDDDIEFVNSQTIGRAFFQNVGQTLRQGAEASINYHNSRLLVYVSYQYLRATFGNALTLNSEDNPAADANGNIFVKAGNRLPGVPLHTVKFGANYLVTPKWQVGFTGRAASGLVLFGDESNQNPSTGSYITFGVDTSYQVTHNLQIFGQVENAFNAKYATYGTFSPTSEVPIVQAPNATNPRSLTPAAPVAGFGGVRVTF